MSVGVTVSARGTRCVVLQHTVLKCGAVWCAGVFLQSQCSTCSGGAVAAEPRRKAKARETQVAGGQPSAVPEM